MGETVGKASLGGKTSFVFGHVTFESLLQIQVDLSSEKLDVLVRRAGVRSVIEVDVWKSPAQRFKPQNWWRSPGE